MELTDIMVKDSEGIVIYHANRDDGGSWNTSIGVQGVQTRLKRNVRFESK